MINNIIIKEPWFSINMGKGKIRAKAIVSNMEARPEPIAPLILAIKGMIPKLPRAIDNNTKPKSCSERPKTTFTSGILVAQLPKKIPLHKNNNATARLGGCLKINLIALNGGYFFR